jgi:hypothetical protein
MGDVDVTDAGVGAAQWWEWDRYVGVLVMRLDCTARAWRVQPFRGVCWFALGYMLLDGGC